MHKEGNRYEDGVRGSEGGLRSFEGRLQRLEEAYQEMTICTIKSGFEVFLGEFLSNAYGNL